MIPMGSMKGRGIRLVALLTGAVLISMAIFALVPLLLNQTSESGFARASHADLIPIRPQLRPEPISAETDLEPPEPLEVPEPKTEAAMPDIPEIAPPEPKSAEPPEITREASEMPPLEMPALTSAPLEPPPLQALPLQAIALSSLPVQSSPLNLKVNLHVAKAPPPRALARATVPQKTGVEGMYFGLHEVDQKPVSLAALKPDYPLRAKRMGIEGYVTVRFLVNREGRAEDPKIVDAEPKDIFDEAVRKSVPRWRFKPGMKAGRSVDTLVEMTIRFELGHDG